MTTIEFTENNELQADGVTIPYSIFNDASSRELKICKSRQMITKLARRIKGFQGGNILEIGIRQGGSTALVAKLARPKKLVALEITPTPLESLQAFIDQENMGDTVKCYYGVDQGDKATLASITDKEFSGELDLVIDDASHLYEPTRASFEVLFPRLREGGLYLLEDWRWEHNMASALASISQLPSAPEVVASPPQMSVEVVKRAIVNLPPANEDFTGHLSRVLDALQDVGSIGPRAANREENSALERTPLTTLALQLVLLKAFTDDVIRSISIDHYWVSVKRGKQPLEGATFTVTPEILSFFNQLR